MAMQSMAAATPSFSFGGPFVDTDNVQQSGATSGTTVTGTGAVVAPLPELGSGLLGSMVVLTGLFLSFRRQHGTQRTSD